MEGQGQKLADSVLGLASILLLEWSCEAFGQEELFSKKPTVEGLFAYRLQARFEEQRQIDVQVLCELGASLVAGRIQGEKMILSGDLSKKVRSPLTSLSRGILLGAMAPGGIKLFGYHWTIKISDGSFPSLCREALP